MPGPVAGMNPSDLRGDDIDAITKTILEYLRGKNSPLWPGAATYTVPVGVDDNGEVETDTINVFAPSDVPVDYNLSGDIGGVIEPGDPTEFGSMEAMVSIMVKEIGNQVTKNVINHIKDNLSVTIPSGTFIEIVTGGAMAPAIGIPNILPVACKVDDLINGALTGATIGVDLT